MEQGAGGTSLGTPGWEGEPVAGGWKLEAAAEHKSDLTNEGVE